MSEIKPGTPLPWAVSKFGDVTAGRDSDGDPFLVVKARNSICSSYSVPSAREAKANYAYIVTACNAYPSLLTGLREAKEALADLSEAARNACDARQHPPLTEALFEATATLAKLDTLLSQEGEG